MSGMTSGSTITSLSFDNLYWEFDKREIYWSDRKREKFITQFYDIINKPENLRWTEQQKVEELEKQFRKILHPNQMPFTSPRGQQLGHIYEQTIRQQKTTASASSSPSLEPSPVGTQLQGQRRSSITFSGSFPSVSTPFTRSPVIKTGAHNVSSTQPKILGKKRVKRKAVTSSEGESFKVVMLDEERRKFIQNLRKTLHNAQTSFQTASNPKPTSKPQSEQQIQAKNQEYEKARSNYYESASLAEREVEEITSKLKGEDETRQVTPEEVTQALIKKKKKTQLANDVAYLIRTHQTPSPELLAQAKKAKEDYEAIFPKPPQKRIINKRKRVTKKPKTKINKRKKSRPRVSNFHARAENEPLMSEDRCKEIEKARKEMQTARQNSSTAARDPTLSKSEKQELRKIYDNKNDVYMMRFSLRERIDEPYMSRFITEGIQPTPKLIREADMLKRKKESLQRKWRSANQLHKKNPTAQSLIEVNNAKKLKEDAENNFEKLFIKVTPPPVAPSALIPLSSLSIPSPFIPLPSLSSSLALIPTTPKSPRNPDTRPVSPAILTAEALPAPPPALSMPTLPPTLSMSTPSSTSSMPTLLPAPPTPTSPPIPSIPTLPWTLSDFTSFIPIPPLPSASSIQFDPSNNDLGSEQNLKMLMDFYDKFES